MQLTSISVVCMSQQRQNKLKIIPSDTHEKFRRKEAYERPCFCPPTWHYVKLNHLLLFERSLLYRVKQTASQGFSSSLPFQGKGWRAAGNEVEREKRLINN